MIIGDDTFSELGEGEESDDSLDLSGDEEDALVAREEPHGKKKKNEVRYSVLLSSNPLYNKLKC